MPQTDVDIDQGTRAQVGGVHLPGETAPLDAHQAQKVLASSKVPVMVVRQPE